MRLNVGCGLDVREGWTNIDTRWNTADDDLEIGDARHLAQWYGQCEVVLLSHVLHLFDYREADEVLDQCVECLAPRGRFVVIEPDVIGMMAMLRAHDQSAETLLRTLIADTVEPTMSGKLLRWVAWHGTRRSLWSREQIIDRLRRRELDCYSYWETPARDVDRLLEGIYTPGGNDPVGRRHEESFLVVGVAR